MKKITGLLLCICTILAFSSCTDSSVQTITQIYTSQTTQTDTTVQSTPKLTKATKKVTTQPTTTEEILTEDETTEPTTTELTTTKIIETIVTTSSTKPKKDKKNNTETSTNEAESENEDETKPTKPEKEKPTEAKVQKKVLVTYFSRTGENYGVGNITKGNTTIVAEMIAESTHADIYEIIPKVPYPSLYKDCLEYAEKEQNEDARPKLKNKLPSLAKYDVIFIGYPVWFEDCPMPVYTFMEGLNWKGKTVVPFCTYAESGLGYTEEYIQSACKGAKMLTGYQVKGKTAQEHPEKVKPSLKKWLSKIKLA